MSSWQINCSACGKLIRKNTSGRCIKCYTGDPRLDEQPVVEATPEERVARDRERVRQKAEFDALKHKYTAALKTIEQQETALGWLEEIRQGVPSTYTIEPQEGSGTSEATPIIVASDWHSEEIVKPSQVNGLNEFNLDIFEQRNTKFWQSGLRLIRLLNQDVKIQTVVLALLGDFITGQIHGAENAESNGLLPVEAVINVQGKIIAGIEFLLNHSAYNFVIPCKVGNHSRTTLKTRYASESGHSLETLLYAHLAAHFRGEPRVTFVFEDSYLSYMEIYDQTIRFHHGHEIKYAGGVGGIFIPAFKDAEWERAGVDLNIFGHFHQQVTRQVHVHNGARSAQRGQALQ
jgi:hypothetical protein